MYEKEAMKNFFNLYLGFNIIISVHHFFQNSFWAGWCSSYTLDLYWEGTWIESQTNYQLLWLRIFVVSTILPDKCYQQVLITSF
jgi:hypothetical protein